MGSKSQTNSFPTFQKQLVHFLHFLHCLGHDQKHWTFGYKRDLQESLWTPSFLERNFSNIETAFFFPFTFKCLCNLHFQYFVSLQFQFQYKYSYFNCNFIPLLFTEFKFPIDYSIILFILIPFAFCPFIFNYCVAFYTWIKPS